MTHLGCSSVPYLKRDAFKFTLSNPDNKMPHFFKNFRNFEGFFTQHNVDSGAFYLFAWLSDGVWIMMLSVRKIGGVMIGLSIMTPFSYLSIYYPDSC